MHCALLRIFRLMTDDLLEFAKLSQTVIQLPIWLPDSRASLDNRSTTPRHYNSPSRIRTRPGGLRQTFIPPYSRTPAILVASDTALVNMSATSRARSLYAHPLHRH